MLRTIEPGKSKTSVVGLGRARTYRRDHSLFSSHFLNLRPWLDPTLISGVSSPRLAS